jgi:hypothetical protein
MVWQTKNIPIKCPTCYMTFSKSENFEGNAEQILPQWQAKMLKPKK